MRTACRVLEASLEYSRVRESTLVQALGVDGLLDGEAESGQRWFGRAIHIS